MSNISLSMIVKNEERYLAQCLDSVKGVVDEIIIVDTGSTDKTKEIASRYNAKVFDFNWTNDFSAARNFALEKSSGEWILYLDADEELDKNSIKEIKKITREKNNKAYYCLIKSLDKESGRDNSIMYPRLFQNDSRLKFAGKVHEQIIPSLQSNGFEIDSSGILIIHHGYDISLNDKKQKAERNLNLLLDEYKADQKPYCEYQLGLTYQILEEDENALKYFLLASENVQLEKSLRAQSFSSLAGIYNKQHQPDEAETNINEAIRLDNQQAFNYLLASKISFRKNELKKAEEQCKQSFILNKDTSVKQSQLQKIFINPEEIIFWGITLALQCGNTLNYNYYQKELLTYYTKLEGNNSKRASVIKKLFSNSFLHHDDVKLICDSINLNNITLYITILSNNPDREKILNVAQNILERYPNNIEAHKFLAKLYEEFNRIDEAVLVLEKVSGDNCSDPAVLFYLLSYYIKQGDINKLKKVVEELENKFSHVSEIKLRLDIIKEKLKKVLSSQ